MSCGGRLSSKRSAPKRLSAGVALGALLAASLTTTASATDEFSLDRIGGGDRYETAALVAAAHDGGNSAILVNGSADNYVDALTANYLAGELQAPVLLTKRDATPSAIRAQLAAEDISDVVVVGGDVAISDQQVTSLEQLGYDVRRVAGINRFETNAAVIDAAGPADQGIGLVATGYDFADSLAGGPLVYQGHPLALSRTDRMDGVVLDALQGAGVTKVYILGGPIAVSDDVVAQLDAAGISVIKRLSGAERASTSVAIADELISQHGFSAEHVNVASGNDSLYGADALSGGPLTGQQNSPLLITNSAGNASRSLDTFLGDHCSTLSTGVVFGGDQAISDVTKSRLEQAAQSCDADDVTDPVLSGALATVENDTVTASVTVTDDVAVESVQAALLDDQGSEVVTLPAEGGEVFHATFTDVSDGTYTVRFVARDTSGNTAEATTEEVIVEGDVTAPVLTGPAVTAQGNEITATVTATDDSGVESVKAELINGQGAVLDNRPAAASGDNYSVDFIEVADGTYKVRFTATDVWGNTAKATTDAVVVDTTLTIGEPYVADDGLTVTLNSLTVTETSGSYRYTINYTLRNDTENAIDEGSWKAYDLGGGDSLAQYGFFGRLFPAETLNRSYTFEEEKAVTFDVVAYHSDQFFNDYPPSDALVWRVSEAQ